MSPFWTFVALAGLFLTLAASASGQITPLRIAPDHRHFIDGSGKPVLITGDAAWSLICGLTDEEAERYLADRHRKGFNAVIVNLIEHKFKGPVDRYGQNPFLTAGDFSTPNEKYFANADRVIRMAAQQGIYVFLAPIYLGYPGTDEGWIKEALANGVDKCREWGLYVGRRYAGADNVVWLMGGDRNPEEAHPEVDAVAAGIREFDKGHLFTAHTHGENTAIDEYGSGGWVDFNTVYSYFIVHLALLWAYGHTPPLPMVLIESIYEGEHNSTALQVRRQAYWTVLRGGAGQFMGNRPIWLFDPGWEQAIDAQGSRDMSRLAKLFTSRNWYDLEPDSTNQVLTGGIGEEFGLDTALAAETHDGRCVIVYLPAKRKITIDLRKMKCAEAIGWWFDPATGRTRKLGPFPTTGSQDLTPPSEGDWVLVLDDAALRLPAPGS